MWNSIENDLVIIGACLPLIPAIFKGRKLSSSKAYPGSPQEAAWKFGTLHQGDVKIRQQEQRTVEVEKNGEGSVTSTCGIQVTRSFSVPSQDMAVPGYELEMKGEGPATSICGIHVERSFSVSSEEMVLPGYESNSYVSMV